MRGRVAIPLHDTPTADLVGYARRLTKEADVIDENSKYRLPGDRERNGVLHAFSKLPPALQHAQNRRDG